VTGLMLQLSYISLFLLEAVICSSENRAGVKVNLPVQKKEISEILGISESQILKYFWSTQGT
jgi:hypothetical protein